MKNAKNNDFPNTCDICTRIVCKQCGWVANDQEVESIRKEVLTACPVCGWKPK